MRSRAAAVWGWGGRAGVTFCPRSAVSAGWPLFAGFPRQDRPPGLQWSSSGETRPRAGILWASRVPAHSGDTVTLRAEDPCILRAGAARGVIRGPESRVQEAQGAEIGGCRVRDRLTWRNKILTQETRCAPPFPHGLPRGPGNAGPHGLHQRLGTGLQWAQAVAGEQHPVCFALSGFYQKETFKGR